MPENSLGLNSDDRKTELREVENGAHGAQSTVVEGASLNPAQFVFICFYYSAQA